MTKEKWRLRLTSDCFFFDTLKPHPHMGVGITFLKKCMFVVYSWLCWVFVAACRLSLVAVSGDCSPVAGRRLLNVVASLVVGCGGLVLDFISCGLWAQ